MTMMMEWRRSPETLETHVQKSIGMRMLQPASLQELSSTAMGIHIAHVYASLIVSNEPTHVELMNSICEGFKSAITSKIPSVMADELTNIWLKHIAWSYSEFKSHFITREHDVVLKQVIRGVVHPKVRYFNEICPKIEIMLCRNLDMMQRLEQLRLPYLDSTTKQSLVDNISRMEHLVCLQIHLSCTNEILCLVGHSCPNITDLDIFGSASVTDESIPAITKLSQLTALNIFDTDISVNGSEKILQATKDRGISLTKFGCSSVQSETLELLLQHQDSLVFVQLAYIHNMMFLASLGHLRALILNSVSFNSLKSMLSTIGSNLLHLELSWVSSVDVSYVGKHCPQLEKFEMENCSYSPWMHLQLDLQLQMFTKLKHLKIFLTSKYPMMSHMDNLVLLLILTNACDIRHLSITTYCIVDVQFVNTLLAVNPLRSLEDINLRSLSETEIDTKTLLSLLHNCINLSNLTVNGRGALYIQQELLNDVFLSYTS